MKVKSIPRSWLNKTGLRLDCNPYMSGGLDAQIRLEELSCKKQPLSELTVSIYHAGREGRTWVESEEYGVPFMSSTDILKADLSTLPLISKRQVDKNPAFTIKEGWTLITRSGTIGRMAYARPDMNGLACSEHVMRVVPDSNKVDPGYLYAFLSSKYGVPQIVAGTYGSIIQSIEPQHISALPVPRFEINLENQVGNLIKKAAGLRSMASELLKEAISDLEEQSGLPSLPHSKVSTPYSISTASSSSVIKRLDGFFYSRYHMETIEILGSNYKEVSEFATSIVEPNRFKRIAIDNDRGMPFFGTSALMHNDPKPSYWLPRFQKGIEQYIVNEKTVLIPRSGQLSGIIGTAVLPIGKLLGGALSEDAIRINCNSPEDSGYIYIALSSQYGLRQLKSRAFGSSIPHLDVRQIGSVRLPNLSEDNVVDIGMKGQSIAKMRNEAIQLEDKARQLVEETIEGAN